jgi:hypothetical protein
MLAVGVAAACGSTSTAADTSRAPAASSTAVVASTTIDPRITAAEANVMAAYNGYINAETAASQAADFGSGDLSKYMTDPLLGQWVAQLFHLHAIGDVQRGAVISKPALVSLKLSKTSGTAIVRDCLDQSQISIVNAKSGKPLSMPATKPYVAIASLYLYSDGRWLVSKVDTTDDKPC